MSYSALGQTKVMTSPGGTTPLTAEQQAAHQLSTTALTICNRLAKSGALVIKSGPFAGQAALLGTAEHTACMNEMLKQLKAGQSEQQATQATIDAIARTKSWSYIFWGTVGASVLLVGVLALTRKKG